MLSLKQTELFTSVKPPAGSVPKALLLRKTQTDATYRNISTPMPQGGSLPYRSPPARLPRPSRFLRRLFPSEVNAAEAVEASESRSLQVQLGGESKGMEPQAHPNPAHLLTMIPLDACPQRYVCNSRLISTCWFSL